jgi:hypothetical protein
MCHQTLAIPCLSTVVGTSKLVGSGSSIVVLVKIGVIVHAANPMAIAAITTITMRIIFFNVYEPTLVYLFIM